MPRSFLVGFKFAAFDRLSGTMDKLSGKFSTMKGKITQLNNKFQVAKQKTEGFRKSLDKIGGRMKAAGRTMTLFVTAPLVALAAKFVSVSSDAEETANKFNEVFKSIDKGTRQAAIDRLKNQFKLATQTAQDFLATSGLIVQGLDLTDEQALKASTRLAELSLDVASFRNVQGGAVNVMAAFNAALVGERERLKTLGIVITEADVKSEALALAQKGARFESVKSAKALASLSLITKLTTRDQGDFQRTITGFANQLRITSERFLELSKVIGDILRPVAAKLLAVINKIQKAFLNLTPEGQRLVVVIAAIAAVIGPLLLAFGTFFTLLAVTKIAAAVLGVTMGVMLLKFILIGAAIAAVVAAGVFLVKNWEKVKIFFLTLWDGPLVRFLRFVTGLDTLIMLGKLVIDNWEPVKAFFVGMWDEIMKAAQPVIDFITPFFNAAKALGGKLINFGKFLLFGDKDPLTGKTDIDTSAADVGERVNQLGSSVVETITRAVNDARIRIDFGNLPPGTTVDTTSTGIPPELNLGLSGLKI